MGLHAFRLHKPASSPVLERMKHQFSRYYVCTNLPLTLLLSLLHHRTQQQVTFAAYLAVLLGTFVPVAFLIILYIQSESRKAGEAAGRGE